MIQPLLSPQTSPTALAPVAALVLDQADFVAFMAEAEPLAHGPVAYPDRPSDTGSQAKDAAPAESIPALPSWDAGDQPSAQDAPAAARNDVAKIPVSPALVAFSGDAPPPAAPQESTQTLPEEKRTKNPAQGFSVAAMAFADLSTAAQTEKVGSILELSPTDALPVRAADDFATAVTVWQGEFCFKLAGEVSFSRGVEAGPPQGLGQQVAVSASGVPGAEAVLFQSAIPQPAALKPVEQSGLSAELKAQQPSDRDVYQESIAPAKTLPSKPEIAFTKPAFSSAEVPVQGVGSKDQIVSNMAETSSLPARVNTHRMAPEMGPLPLAEVASPPQIHLRARITADDVDAVTMARHPDRQADPISAPTRSQTETKVTSPPGAPSVSWLNRAAGHSESSPDRHSHPTEMQAGPQPSPSRQVGSAGPLAVEAQISWASDSLPDRNAVSTPHAHFLQDPSPHPEAAQAGPQPSPSRHVGSAGPLAVEAQISWASDTLPDRNAVLSPDGQEARPSNHDSAKAFAEVGSDGPFIVPNLSEIRVNPASFEPDPAALLAMTADGGPRPADDDPALTRPPAIPAPLSTEIIRLVQFSPDGPVTLTLRPDDLGTLRFEVKQTDQGLHIHLCVEQPQTLELLRRQGDQLLADLRHAGFAGASLSFTGDGAQDASAQQRDQSKDAPSLPRPSPAHDHLSPKFRPIGLPGSLDLRL